MPSQRLLFICGRGRQRSPTAAAIFAGLSECETRSAGISRDADEPLTSEDLAWADVVFVFEPQQRRKLHRDFRPWLRDKRVICLGIADDYAVMSPALIALLWARVPATVPALSLCRPNTDNRDAMTSGQGEPASPP